MQNNNGNDPGNAGGNPFNPFNPLYDSSSAYSHEGSYWIPPPTPPISFTARTTPSNAHSEYSPPPLTPSIQSDQYSNHATHDGEFPPFQGQYNHGPWAQAAHAQHAPPPPVAHAPRVPMEFVHQPQQRTMGDYLQPEATASPSCITYPYNAGVFNFRPGMLSVLPLFYGRDNEDPYPHIRDFEGICHTFEDHRVIPELIRLKLFPFSLKDRAKEWLSNLPSNSIGSWKELQQ